MHRALYIEEIVREVAAYVDCREDQLSMSLACRVFNDPAMDRLWHTLKSMQRLVHCLPHELLEDEQEQGRWITKFAKLPSEQQWDRFRQYARRVRTIHLFDTYFSLSVEGSIGVYDVIREYHPYPQYCLFPRLYDFSSCIDITEHLDIFLQPSLRRVSCSIKGGGEGAAALDLIAARCPALEVPHIHVHSSTPLFLSALTRALLSWKYITEVSFHDPLEEETLRHLSRLQCLKRLDIYFYESHCTPFPESNPSEPLFPSLQTLTICNDFPDKPRKLLNWLRSIRPPRLREIRIWQPCSPAAHGLVRELFTILATYTTMEEVMISFRGDFEDDEDSESSTSNHLTAEEVLLPLISNLPNVRELSLHRLPLDWTPAFLGRLASAWPKLVKLELSDCGVPMCKIQVSDLLPFAQLCPALRRLVIHVSPHMPQALPGTVDRESNDVEIDHGLETLTLSGAVFESDAIPQVAAFLDKYFPSARLYNHPYVSARKVRDDALKISQSRIRGPKP